MYLPVFCNYFWNKCSAANSYIIDTNSGKFFLFSFSLNLKIFNLKFGIKSDLWNRWRFDLWNFERILIATFDRHRISSSWFFSFLRTISVINCLKESHSKSVKIILNQILRLVYITYLCNFIQRLMELIRTFKTYLELIRCSLNFFIQLD